MLHTSQETCLSTPLHIETGHKGMSSPAILLLPRNATDTTHYRKLGRAGPSPRGQESLTLRTSYRHQGEARRAHFT